MPGGQGGPEERDDISRLGRRAVPKPQGFGAVMTLPTVQQAASIPIPNSPSGPFALEANPFGQGVAVNKHKATARELMTALGLAWPPASVTGAAGLRGSKFKPLLPIAPPVNFGQSIMLSPARRP